jgi:hypothetical protein
MSGISLRDKILNAQDIKSEVLNVPEWGVDILIKSLTGKKRAVVMGEAMDKDGKMNFENMYADMAITSSYDPNTQQLIFESTDRNVLNEKNGGILEKIAQVVIRISGLDVKAVEKATKN